MANTADTNTLAEACDNKFEFDIASVSFAPDISHLPLSNDLEFDKETTTEEPVQLKIPSPGECPDRPLALSEFIDLFYKNNQLGSCEEITYPLIDITNSTKQLLIPALCNKESLDDIVTAQGGDVWCDITLKSFGRSPWWQTLELSTSMASAIAELNCRHNIFCKKMSNIMRTSVYDCHNNLHSTDAMRQTLPNYHDIDRCKEQSGIGNERTGQIPSLCDLEQYLEAWCGVLRIARALGYYPKPPKNLVPLTNVCWENNLLNKCCEPLNLFKNEIWDIVPELCENIKNIRDLSKINIDTYKYTFLHYRNGKNEPTCPDDTRGFTNKLNCCEEDHSTMAIDTQGNCESWNCDGDMHDCGSRYANPTGYRHVSGFLKLIQMGLFDWSGCLAGRDCEPDWSNQNEVEKEVKDDMQDWQKWFVDLKAEGDCAYDYDSSHMIPNNPVGDRHQGNLKVAFLLKLATMKFSSSDSFKTMLNMENFVISDSSANYDYSNTLMRYFNTVSKNTDIVNNCDYYNPCKRMTIKKNIIKSNKGLKRSLIRLCGCSLTKDELLTTISDFIIRDMNRPDGGVNNIINAKMNINYCKKGNGIENVVMYDANISIDIGVYASLASICKDKESVDRVLKYVFNNPNNDVLSTVAESLLVELQTLYPACYPSGFNKTQVSEYGMEIYSNVLAGASNPYGVGEGNRSNPSLSTSLLSYNKFMDCFKVKSNFKLGKSPCTSGNDNSGGSCSTCN